MILVEPDLAISHLCHLEAPDSLLKDALFSPMPCLRCLHYAHADFTHLGLQPAPTSTTLPLGRLNPLESLIQEPLFLKLGQNFKPHIPGISKIPILKPNCFKAIFQSLY